MAAGTISKINKASVIKSKLITFQWVGTSSYTTGGDSINLTALGLTEVEFFDCEMQNGYVGRYDYTNNKLMFYWTGASTSAVLAEITSTTDISGVTFHCLVVGR